MNKDQTRTCRHIVMILSLSYLITTSSTSVLSAQGASGSCEPSNYAPTCATQVSLDAYCILEPQSVVSFYNCTPHSGMLSDVLQSYLRANYPTQRIEESSSSCEARLNRRIRDACDAGLFRNAEGMGFLGCCLDSLEVDCGRIINPVGAAKGILTRINKLFGLLPSGYFPLSISAKVSPLAKAECDPRHSAYNPDQCCQPAPPETQACPLNDPLYFGSFDECFTGCSSWIEEQGYICKEWPNPVPPGVEDCVSCHDQCPGELSFGSAESCKKANSKKIADKKGDCIGDGVCWTYYEDKEPGTEPTLEPTGGGNPPPGDDVPGGDVEYGPDWLPNCWNPHICRWGGLLRSPGNRCSPGEELAGNCGTQPAVGPEAPGPTGPRYEKPDPRTSP